MPTSAAETPLGGTCLRPDAACIDWDISLRIICIMSLPHPAATKSFPNRSIQRILAHFRLASSWRNILFYHLSLYLFGFILFLLVYTLYWSLFLLSLPPFCDRTSRSFYLVLQQMADTRANSASLSKVNSLNVPNLVPEPPLLTFHPLLQQWRESFPGLMDLDAIYKVLQACNFEDDKIQASIARIWNMVGIFFLSSCSHCCCLISSLLDKFEDRYPFFSQHSKCIQASLDAAGSPRAR